MDKKKKISTKEKAETAPVITETAETTQTSNTEEKPADTPDDTAVASNTEEKPAEIDTGLEAAKAELEMMKNLSVSKLWKNSGGEYFTSDNLAYLSEKGNKENVTVINKTDLETIIKSLS